jgi:N-acyl-D-amino-acid deacylase
MKRRLFAAVSALIVCVCLAGAQAPQFDLLITNARIVDGTGTPWYRGEVAVKGDAIVAVAPKVEGSAARTIDAKGQVVAPGFIDTHTHARRGIFEVPTADNYVRQGVTTVFEGPTADPTYRSGRSWRSSKGCANRSTSAASSGRGRSAPR